MKVLGGVVAPISRGGSCGVVAVERLVLLFQVGQDQHRKLQREFAGVEEQFRAGCELRICLENRAVVLADDVVLEKLKVQLCDVLRTALAVVNGKEDDFLLLVFF